MRTRQFNTVKRDRGHFRQANVTTRHRIALVHAAATDAARQDPKGDRSACAARASKPREHALAGRPSPAHASSIACLIGGPNRARGRRRRPLDDRRQAGGERKAAPGCASSPLANKDGGRTRFRASLLGLLAKIKCSICSYQLNI